MPSNLDDDLPGEDDLELEDELPLNDDEPLNEDDDEEKPDVKPSASSLSPQQIAELAAQTAMKLQPQQTPRELSPEELDARLNRFKVSPEIVKLLRDPEASPEAIIGQLQALVDGAAKYAVTSAQLLYQKDLTDHLSPLQQQIQAQQQFVQEQQTRTFVKHIGTQFPALAGKDAVIRQALQAVQQSGYIPKSKSDAQKQVALVARDMIRTVDPNFSLKANSARQAGNFAPRQSFSGGGRQSNQQKTGAASFAEYL